MKRYFRKKVSSYSELALFPRLLRILPDSLKVNFLVEQQWQLLFSPKQERLGKGLLIVMWTGNHISRLRLPYQKPQNKFILKKKFRKRGS